MDMDDETEYDLEDRDCLSEEKGSDDIIDNTDITYTSTFHPICIRLNTKDERRNQLQMSEKSLCKKYPHGMALLEKDNRLESLLSKVFPDGMQKRLYVRNLSFTTVNGGEVKVLGIRPEIYPGDFLSEMLPEGYSLHCSGCF